MAKKKAAQTTDVTQVETLAIPVHLIELDPELNGRVDFGKPRPADHEALVELSESIASTGQILPGAVLAWPDPETKADHYTLIDGARRRAAIEMNSKLGGKDTMDCRIFRGGDKNDAFRKMLSANIHRVDFSPLQMATHMANTRIRLGTTEKPAPYSEVARYIGVSKPKVMKFVKMLEWDGEIQAAVHSGELAMSAGQELHENTLKEQAAAVRARAKELADEEKAKLAAEGKTDEPTTEPTTDENGEVVEGAEATETADGEQTAPEPGKVQARHIEEAARQLDAQVTDKPRSKKVVEAFFDMIAQSPAYGYRNSPARVFASKVLSFMGGSSKVTEKSLANSFQTLAESSGEGTPNATELADQQEQDKAAREREAKKLLKKQSKVHGAAVPTEAVTA